MQSCFCCCADSCSWLYRHPCYLTDWQPEKFRGLVQGSEGSRSFGVRHCLEAVLSAMLLQRPMVRHICRIASLNVSQTAALLKGGMSHHLPL